jgi:hypothetical protein
MSWPIHPVDVGLGAEPSASPATRQLLCWASRLHIDMRRDVGLSLASTPETGAREGLTGKGVDPPV